MLATPTITYDVATSESYQAALETKPARLAPQKTRISYHHHEDVGDFHFGPSHPMKPHRLTLTNQLVLGYGLHKHMEVYRPRRATVEELQSFHTDDYIEFLRRVTPGNEKELADLCAQFSLADDCPVFDGLYDFCSLYSGSSLDAARKLLNKQSDVAINWSGGLHHAKKREASGFCYVNDIVIAILELLRYHPRVLYIDIDVHHGDGVQDSFYFTDRVFTLSIHRYGGDFFPCTGDWTESGSSQGKYHCMNIPLNPGIDDESYINLFKTIVEPLIETYRPTSIVLQCGADSLGLDRIGGFNLSIKAHGACVEYVKQFGLPTLVLGGGGYTIRNVARCWTYETGLICGFDLPRQLPETPYMEFFEPDYSLHPNLSEKQANQNSKRDLERIRRQALEQIRYIGGAPSVQMQVWPADIQVLDTDKKIREEREEMGLGQNIRWRT